jgi:predicted phage terminase large subunit-like protein
VAAPRLRGECLGQGVRKRPGLYHVLGRINLLNDLDPELLAFANAEELALIEQAIKLETALMSPLDFACYVNPDTTVQPHLALINEVVVALIEHRLYKWGIGASAVKLDSNMWVHPETGEPCIIKLSISMPPRHGKSYLISEHLPAWFLCKYPDKSVILASYSDDFAASWGLKSRRIIEAHPEFGVELDPSSRSGSKWGIRYHRGAMQTAGAGGLITGTGGDILIGDDLIKNDEEVRSKTERDNKENWWISTFRTRVQPGGDSVIINVHTRWHEDDITGRLLATEDDWYTINLPAIAFPETDDEGYSIDIEQGGRRDPLNRRPGEALCPAFFSADQLRASSSDKGAQWFSALFQGRPSLDDGGIFTKSDMRFHTRKGNVYELETDTGVDRVEVSKCYRFITVDLAASTRTSADYTVFSLWDSAPGNRLILADRLRDRMESADHMDQLLTFVRKHTDEEQGLKVRFIGVEKATYGLTLVQNLIRTPGVIVRSLNPDKDKWSRALPAGQAMKNHQVFFPKDAPWINEWVDELVKFDNVAHDDQVDTFSYAVDVWLSLPNTIRAESAGASTLEERVEANLKKLTSKKVGRVRAGMLGRW